MSSSSSSSQGIVTQAKAWVKSNRTLILERFASDEICPPEPDPVSIFMAGAMGAGKTEFSRNYIRFSDRPFVHLDLDAIRYLLPGYDSQNPAKLNYPAILALEFLHTYCLRKKKSFVFDSSFSNEFSKISLKIEGRRVSKKDF